MIKHRPPAVAAIITRRRALAAGIAIPLGCLSQGAWAASPGKPVNLNITSDGDLLAFKPDRLTCPTGATVHLTFYHTGKYITQDHNWVLTRPGAADAVAKTALEASENSAWTPAKDPRVLAATPPCPKGQHVSVDFTAPPAGDYPFLCTTPGHGAVMHGVLYVTPG
jgi:azurin